MKKTEILIVCSQSKVSERVYRLRDGTHVCGLCGARLTVVHP